MYKNGNRMMAWVAKIDQVVKHPDADSLDICTVGGWNCITKLGEFKQGDLAVYVSIDSWVPHELAPFLSKGKEPREYNGVRGERLRTVKLRGQVSQGLLLANLGDWGYQEGEDVSERLGIQKWEAPIPAELAGNARGAFPNFVPKTNQERIQNLSEELTEWIDNDEFVWEVTEKLDGSSMTVYFMDSEFGVCSRNWDLAPSDSNTLWRVACEYNLPEKLAALGRNIAIQGELIGEGIQGNPYKIRGQDFYVFDMFDIDAYEYLSAKDRYALTEQLGLKHVPIMDHEYVIRTGMTQLLDRADGFSRLDNVIREGLVFKNLNDPAVSFKAISNRFLLREK